MDRGVIAAAKAELRAAEHALSDHEAICLACHQYKGGYVPSRCHRGRYLAENVERCGKQIGLLAGHVDEVRAQHPQDELF